MEDIDYGAMGDFEPEDYFYEPPRVRWNVCVRYAMLYMATILLKAVILYYRVQMEIMIKEYEEGELERSTLAYDQNENASSIYADEIKAEL